MLTLEEVKLFLKVDADDEDEYINSLISFSKEYCENYIRMSLVADEIPQSIKQAMLIIIGYFYENREGTKEGVSIIVRNLLDPYREAEW